MGLWALRLFIQSGGADEGGCEVLVAVPEHLLASEILERLKTRLTAFAQTSVLHRDPHSATTPLDPFGGIHVLRIAQLLPQTSPEERSEAMLLAIYHGSDHAVDALLAGGMPANSMLLENASALTYAVIQAQPGAVMALLKAGTNANPKRAAARRGLPPAIDRGPGAPAHAQRADGAVPRGHARLGLQRRRLGQLRHGPGRPAGSAQHRCAPARIRGAVLLRRRLRGHLAQGAARGRLHRDHVQPCSLGAHRVHGGGEQAARTARAEPHLQGHVSDVAECRRPCARTGARQPGGAGELPQSARFR